jgi:hypothetical protein
MATMYNPLYLVPAHGLYAIYWQKEDGKVRLFRSPVVALAVAQELEFRNGRWKPAGPNNVIVAAELTDGEFHISQDAHNFLGIVRSDEGHDDLLARLPDEVRDREVVVEETA